LGFKLASSLKERYLENFSSQLEEEFTAQAFSLLNLPKWHLETPMSMGM
jgi:hypothetical protein